MIFPAKINDYYINSIRYTDYAPITLEKSNNLRLIMVKCGVLSYLAGNNTLNQQRSTGVLLSGEKITLFPSQDCSYLVAEFSGITLSPLKYFSFSTSRTHREIFSLWDKDFFVFKTRLFSCLETILYYAEKLLSKTKNEVFHFKIEADLMERAKKFIDDNYTQNINVFDVADAVFISEGYLSRNYAKKFNISPKQYILQKRISLAKNLLINSSLSSSEIALKVGFSNPQRFNDIFRKHIGLSPLEYRKTNK